MPDQSLQQSALGVSRSVVDAVVGRRVPLTRVKAPPGAGKTRLTRQVMLSALDRNVSCMVTVQTNAQAIDLVTGMADLLASGGHRHVFGYWPSGPVKEDEYPDVVQTLREHPNVTVCESTSEADAGPDVLVAVARKWAVHCSSHLPRLRLERSFDLGVIDEAYQMRTGELLRFGDRMERLLMVGDPGQLDPFTTMETGRWTGQDASALAPAPSAIRSLQGTAALTAFDLPASFRLDARAVPVVQRCFYPDLAFLPVAQVGDRELSLHSSGRRDPLDPVLDHAAAHGWALAELPEMFGVRDDADIATTLVGLAERLLSRGAEVTAEWPVALQHGAPLPPSHIAIAVAHRDQRASVQRLLAERPQLSGVVADTANRLQGREFDVVLVWHPLSGRLDASEFHLDTGRLCVMTSRHRQACVLVTRAGLGPLLDDHLPSGQRPREATEDREHDGWLAHRKLLEFLEPHTVKLPQP